MNKVLVLRQCNKDLKSYGGFQHPSSGHVSAPDWNPKPECGSGLHGFLYGEGDGSLANYDPENKWLVLSVDKDKIVDLSGKVKFPEGEVIFCGALAEAARYVYDNGGAGRAIIGITVTGGNSSTVTGGYYSTVTGGDGSTVSGGDDSTVSGGNSSKVTGGEDSAVTGGDGSTVSGGDRSTVTGGYGSKVTGGDGSTVSGGNSSKVTGGEDSTVTGGEKAMLSLQHWDSKTDRVRQVTAYVGENGIEAGKAYKLDENHQFVLA